MMRTAVLGLSLFAACSRAAAPPPPVASEFIEVSYPPPPAQIEERDAELRGRPDCRWLDGHYDYRGRRWQWIPGQWIVPPPGCWYARQTLAWSPPPHARLYYTPPRWYRANDDTPCQAPVPCLTQRPPPAP